MDHSRSPSADEMQATLDLRAQQVADDLELSEALGRELLELEGVAKVLALQHQPLHCWLVRFRTVLGHAGIDLDAAATVAEVLDCDVYQSASDDAGAVQEAIDALPVLERAAEPDNSNVIQLFAKKA